MSESGWILIEQRVDPDPLDVVADELFRSSSCEMRTDMIEKLEEDCSLEHLNPTGKKMSIDELIRAVPTDLPVTCPHRRSDSPTNQRATHASPRPP